MPPTVNYSYVPYFTRRLQVYGNFHDRVSTNTCTVYLGRGVSVGFVDGQKTPLRRVTHQREALTDTIQLVHYLSADMRSGNGVFEQIQYDWRETSTHSPCSTRYRKRASWIQCKCNQNYLERNASDKRAASITLSLRLLEALRRETTRTVYTGLVWACVRMN